MKRFAIGLMLAGLFVGEGVLFTGQADEIARERGVAERVAGRGFPSVFQAWNGVEGLEGLSELERIAKHDLYFSNPWGFKLVWQSQAEGKPEGESEALTGDSVERGLAMRHELLRLNPYMVMLAEVRYRDAHQSFLSEGSGWWKRDENGEVEPGWAEGGYWLMDFGNAEFRAHVAARAKALVESGVVDGVMLDWWDDDEDRLELLRAVRDAIGEDALIMVNSNDRRVPGSAGMVNGLFMEAWRSETAEDWARIGETLLWAERELREPRVNCLETWHHGSRDQLNLMRAVTTLGLTHGNGYVLFSDPNDLPGPDHLHDWYGFWDARLGKPVGEGIRMGDEGWTREYEGGTAVYVPMGGGDAMVEFREERRSAGTGEVSNTFNVKAGDGDIFVRVGEENGQ